MRTKSPRIDFITASSRGEYTPVFGPGTPDLPSESSPATNNKLVLRNLHRTYRMFLYPRRALLRVMDVDHRRSEREHRRNEDRRVFVLITILTRNRPLDSECDGRDCPVFYDMTQERVACTVRVAWRFAADVVEIEARRDD